MLHKRTKPSLFGPPPAPAKPRKPLARAPLKQKRAGLSGAQQRAYREVDGQSNGCCFACKEWACLDHSHILPQGQNKSLRANPLNILLECRKCHCLFGEKLSEYARLFPEALAEKVRRMQLLDPSRYAFWMMKNAGLLVPPARLLLIGG